MAGRLTDAPVTIDGGQDHNRDPAPSPAQIEPSVEAEAPNWTLTAADVERLLRKHGARRRTPKQIRDSQPPIPRGHEWRRADDGWNLWRCWSEKDQADETIRKSRYVGTLSYDDEQQMRVDPPARSIGFTSSGFRAVEAPQSSADSASLGSIPQDGGKLRLGSIPKTPKTAAKTAAQESRKVINCNE